MIVFITVVGQSESDRMIVIKTYIIITVTIKGIAILHKQLQHLVFVFAFSMLLAETTSAHTAITADVNYHCFCKRLNLNMIKQKNTECLLSYSHHAESQKQAKTAEKETQPSINKISEVEHYSEESVNVSSFDSFPQLAFGSLQQLVYQLKVDQIKGKLRGTSRLKVLGWMMELAKNCRLSRMTYSFACYYFDLYIQKANQVMTGQLQITGAVCMILAAKFEQGLNLKLACQLFSQAELTSLEMSVLQTIGHNLCADTYIFHIEHIFKMWDIFVEFCKLQQPIMFCEANNRSFLLRIRLYERLQCLNLVINSLSMSYWKLSLNLFFIMTYFQLKHLEWQDFPDEKLTKTIKTIYSLNSLHLTFFRKFIQNCFSNDRTNDLSQQAGIYIIPFLKVPTTMHPALISVQDDCSECCRMQVHSMGVLQVSSRVMRQLV